VVGQRASVSIVASAREGTYQALPLILEEADSVAWICSVEAVVWFADHANALNARHRFR